MAKPSLTNQKLANLADVLEIKSYPEPAWLPQDKNRVFHWNYGFVEEDFFSNLPIFGKKLLKVRLFSADLGPASSVRQGILPLAKIYRPNELEKKMDAALNLVRQYYSGPIGAENYNYYPTGLYERIADPRFITRLIKKFGLYLVLDLAHARVSAFNLKTPILDYLGQLPLSRVAEIHVSRPYIPKQKNALAVDTHLPPGPTEWRLLKWLLTRIPPPWPLLVVECYQSSSIVLAAYEKLLAVVKDIKPLAVKEASNPNAAKMPLEPFIF
ncbi:MAG: DUF692 family protein [Deltaproteobacteria bacterium]|nr:DUF692 family protein [Deltaproteobacteria bacterium]